MRVAIFDIDGTLANCQHRVHHLRGEGKKDWDAFYEAMHLDEPIEEIAFLAFAVWAAGLPIILCTGRPETYREKTEAWLLDHDVKYRELYMRADGDFRDDAIVKREMLGHIRALDDVVLVVDDRDRVVKMWRDEGLTCIQVAPGDF